MGTDQMACILTKVMAGPTNRAFMTDSILRNFRDYRKRSSLWERVKIMILGYRQSHVCPHTVHEHVLPLPCVSGLVCYGTAVWSCYVLGISKTHNSTVTFFSYHQSQIYRCLGSTTGLALYLRCDCRFIVRLLWFSDCTWIKKYFLVFVCPAWGETKFYL